MVNKKLLVKFERIIGKENDEEKQKKGKSK